MITSGKTIVVTVEPPAGGTPAGYELPPDGITDAALADIGMGIYDAIFHAPAGMPPAVTVPWSEK